MIRIASLACKTPLELLAEAFDMVIDEKADIEERQKRQSMWLSDDPRSSYGSADAL